MGSSFLTPVGVGDLAKAPIAQATQRALSGPSLLGSVSGDQEDRLAGLISLGGVGGGAPIQVSPLVTCLLQPFARCLIGSLLSY